MSGAVRAGLFDEDDPGRDLDVSGFAPKVPMREMPAPEEVKAIAEARGFPSREPGAGTSPNPTRQPKRKREPRRYRTGRNVQLNIKARQDTIDTFNRLCETQGWVQGETLARAVAALERELTGSP